MIILSPKGKGNKSSLAYLIAMIPIIALAVYLSKTLDGAEPAGSGIVLLFRYMGPIVLCLIVTSVIIAFAGEEQDNEKKNEEGKSFDSLRAKDELVKKSLMKSELCKVVGNIKKPGKKTTSKIIVIGFERISSKYYLSVANFGTPKDKIEKQFFLSYPLMSSALYDQTGLLVIDVADAET